MSRIEASLAKSEQAKSELERHVIEAQEIAKKERQLRLHGLGDSTTLIAGHLFVDENERRKAELEAARLEKLRLEREAKAAERLSRLEAELNEATDQIKDQRDQWQEKIALNEAKAADDLSQAEAKWRERNDIVQVEGEKKTAAVIAEAEVTRKQLEKENKQAEKKFDRQLQEFQAEAEATRKQLEEEKNQPLQ